MEGIRKCYMRYIYDKSQPLRIFSLRQARISCGFSHIFVEVEGMSPSHTCKSGSCGFARRGLGMSPCPFAVLHLNPIRSINYGGLPVKRNDIFLFQTIHNFVYIIFSHIKIHLCLRRPFPKTLFCSSV